MGGVSCNGKICIDFQSQSTTLIYSIDICILYSVDLNSTEQNHHHQQNSFSRSIRISQISWLRKQHTKKKTRYSKKKLAHFLALSRDFVCVRVLPRSVVSRKHWEGWMEDVEEKQQQNLWLRVYNRQKNNVTFYISLTRTHLLFIIQQKLPALHKYTHTHTHKHESFLQKS